MGSEDWLGMDKGTAQVGGSSLLSSEDVLSVGGSAVEGKERGARPAGFRLLWISPIADSIVVETDGALIKGRVVNLRAC